MTDDIDPLAGAEYAHGREPIDVAVERVATLIEVRDEVLKARNADQNSFPGFGATEGVVIGRRVVALLLDAGWRAPSSDVVEDAANRLKESGIRFRRVARQPQSREPSARP